MLLIHGEKSSCFLTTCLFTFLFEFEVPFVIVPLILAIRKRARDPPRRAGEGGWVVKDQTLESGRNRAYSYRA